MARKRKASAWKTVREAAKQVVEAVSPVRMYADHVLSQPPPVTPRAPYEGPVPPEWMRAPEMVIGPEGQPHHWIDTEPMALWERKRGRALYELRKEEVRDAVRAAGGQSQKKHWDDEPDYDPHLRDLRYVNHPSRRMTVRQREERDATGRWGKPAPKPRQEEQLPEAEMCWAPWWLE
ncbi:hypothetical protein C0216_08725 [Streptomyces globosus]|uniref:Uncharacterized protein n=1 Tax=Streptomyces globosus TaxID=68209 RepID=A0A344TY15_9ACTN|nr:hypothetical protein [Streptomyces globosus]AXE23536.1 hypothetical protein C0216_08725 [Streptomyces globosus]